tara:strand:- start:1233 stop:1805 length:573 start_codon:yes stop_codon:yes gene_type:complete
MKVLPFDLNTTTTGRNEGEKLEFLRPGAYSCKITGIITSDQYEDYKGSPYISFNVTSGGKIARARFWTVKETDKPSTQDWKKKQIKEFLVNAGVKDFSDDSKAMNSAIGNSLMITFISEEYIGTNRDTKEPVIREAVKYRWSAKDRGKCSYNPDMNQTLSEDDMQEFKSRHVQWSDSQSIPSIDSEDTPF